MNLNDAYTSYKLYPNSDSLTVLLEAVRSVAVSRLHDEDAAQQAVILVMNRLDSLTLSKSFEQWLAGVLKHYRSARLRSKTRQPALLDEETYTEPATYWTVDYTAVVEHIVPLIPDGSPERQLAGLVLAGATVRDAASQLGLSESAARKKLRRCVRFF